MGRVVKGSLEDRPVAAEGGAYASQLILYRFDLVVEGLHRFVHPLVELEDGVDAGEAGLERDVVQLADDVEDVLDAAFELGAHGVEPEADLVLGLEAALHLGDVLAGARRGTAEADHCEICRGHQSSLTPSRSNGAAL